MTFNTDLAERVLAQIKDYPETWNQGGWRCQTTMCFAGWAGELAGVRWLHSHSGWLAGGDHISNVARLELGLTSNRAWELFYEADTIEDIERLVKHFANEPDSDSLPPKDES